jgi:hypothetical protein
VLDIGPKEILSYPALRSVSANKLPTLSHKLEATNVAKTKLTNLKDL